MSEKLYPNLSACRVVLTSGVSVDGKPAPKIPQECVEAVTNFKIPQLYDFQFEEEVIRRHEERQKDSETTQLDSREALQEAYLKKLKSITNASEETCQEYLEKNDYQLKAAIEDFYSNS